MIESRKVESFMRWASAVLAKIAFCALAASLSVFWWVAASLLTSLRLARWRILSGALASVCVALMVVFPYDTHRWSHVVTTLLAGGFGFVATVFIMVGSLRSGTIAPWRHVWGAALLVVAIVNIVVYADMLLRDYRDSVALPVVQKFATLLFAMWMIVTVLDSWSDHRGDEDFALFECPAGARVYLISSAEPIGYWVSRNFTIFPRCPARATSSADLPFTIFAVKKPVTPWLWS